jgi:hypothetical protein
MLKRLSLRLARRCRGDAAAGGKVGTFSRHIPARQVSTSRE